MPVVRIKSVSGCRLLCFGAYLTGVLRDRSRYSRRSGRTVGDRHPRHPRCRQPARRAGDGALLPAVLRRRRLRRRQGRPLAQGAVRHRPLLPTCASTASGADVIVTVVENPVINQVAFEGNSEIDTETLRAEVQLKPRSVFTRARVQSDVQRILDVYRRQGRYAATVEPKIIELEQDRVNLVFEIDEGRRHQGQGHQLRRQPGLLRHASCATSSRTTRRAGSTS